MRRPVFIAAIILILLAAAWLRTVWITSDPPTVANGWVGVVWHDEGAWVHNARNRALWGVWRTDNWNPIFLTPVFTGLEYAVFDTLGVGTWQARVVPIVSGLAAVMFLMAGLRALAGARSAAIGGALLATNSVGRVLSCGDRDRNRVRRDALAEP
jgi:predicted membrane-bound mannosyltransferase